MSSILWLFIIHQKVAPVIINLSGPFLLLEEADYTFLLFSKETLNLNLNLYSHRGESLGAVARKLS